MKRSTLKSIANKSGKIEDKKRYKIQRNVVTKLNKKTGFCMRKTLVVKGCMRKTLVVKGLTRVFVRMKKQFLLKKEVLRKDSKISDTFNTYFVNTTDELGIYKWGNIPLNCLDSTEKIKFFNNHPSIKIMKDEFRNSFNFKFEFVSTDIVEIYK